MRGRAVIQAILSDEILCKIEMSFRQNKEATIRSVEIFWQQFIMQIFKSRE